MASSFFKYDFIHHLVVWRIRYIFLNVKISYSFILTSIDYYRAKGNYQRTEHLGLSKIPQRGGRTCFFFVLKIPLERLSDNLKFLSPLAESAIVAMATTAGRGRG
jgi:hypothetical protein